MCCLLRCVSRCALAVVFCLSSVWLVFADCCVLLFCGQQCVCVVLLFVVRCVLIVVWCVRFVVGCLLCGVSCVVAVVVFFVGGGGVVRCSLFVAR